MSKYESELNGEENESTVLDNSSIVKVGDFMKINTFYKSKEDVDGFITSLCKDNDGKWRIDSILCTHEVGIDIICMTHRDTNEKGYYRATAGSKIIANWY